MRSKQGLAGDVQAIDRDVVAQHVMGTASSSRQQGRRVKSNELSCYVILLASHQLLIECLLSFTLVPYLFDPREPQKTFTVGMTDMTRQTVITNVLCIQI